MIGLRVAMFVCGVSSAFSLSLMGELFWAELLLPLVALIVLIARPPRALFANGTFRLLMLGVVLLLLGYLIADLVAGTPRDMYLRGWARVVVLGTNAFSLCVAGYTDRRSLWAFCVGVGLGGIALAGLHGVPLSQWKLGYGGPSAMAATSFAGLLPPWMASLAVGALGGISMLLDYRSLGALLMLVALAVFLRARNVELRRLWRNLPLILVGFGVVAIVAIRLMEVSQDQNMLRREVSDVSRFASLRIGVRAIADSPLMGRGSWGQGTQDYADMLYDETVDDMLAAGAGDMLRRGEAFNAHSQILQSWMEGGLLAASFFIIYIVALIRSLYYQALARPVDYLTPLALYVMVNSLWHSVMSPFLGSHRLTIALGVAFLVVLSAEVRSRATAGQKTAAAPLLTRQPANLMR
ncbi:MAG: O-antigen ligase family protein [Nevskiaceae bacterium]|jgi:hypothetical protein|nr:O-antigen ligase family protein [Nevskiaceae bacterium]